MSCKKSLQQMIGITLVMLLLVGCGAPTATPTRTGPPTYSEVLRTYPERVELCKTVASLEAVGQGGRWLLDGDVEYRDSRALIDCYGTKISINVRVEIDGKTYEPGAKLTVDKDLNWIEVWSWE